MNFLYFSRRNGGLPSCKSDLGPPFDERHGVVTRGRAQIFKLRQTATLLTGADSCSKSTRWQSEIEFFHACHACWCILLCLVVRIPHQSDSYRVFLFGSKGPLEQLQILFQLNSTTSLFPNVICVEQLISMCQCVLCIIQKKYKIVKNSQPYSKSVYHSMKKELRSIDEGMSPQDPLVKRWSKIKRWAGSSI